ncbi:hypothetical protein B296_00018267 [Ensete ventricosum]|uniref:Survival protein SurE-like phosphatase/nucleotidase domain-containing protein n=1 Tax=Ensete ventricosum TaxID=4639 RepID=A0A426YWU9_ENSVE|nr:hypothetical protein B296_00018267 [Ensete ventricosum]
MTTSPTSTRNRQLPPSLVANLHSVLAGRKPPDGDGVEGDSSAAPVEAAADSEPAVGGPRKPVVLVTNADGISSPGLTHLVEALVRIGQYDVYVCAPESFYSGAVAGAREALMIGVPSVAISLNWDIEKGLFPRKCMLNIEIPTAPSKNKVCYNKTEKLSRHCIFLFFCNIGAARRSGGQSKMVETESVAAAGKPDQREVVKKVFRLEEGPDEDVDFRALKNGYVSAPRQLLLLFGFALFSNLNCDCFHAVQIAVTPLHLDMHVELESEIRACLSDWLSAALEGCRDAS